MYSWYQKCLKQLSKAFYGGEAVCHEAVWPLSTWCGGAAVPRGVTAMVPSHLVPLPLAPCAPYPSAPTICALWSPQHMLYNCGDTVTSKGEPQLE